MGNENLNFIARMALKEQKLDKEYVITIIYFYPISGRKQRF